MSEALRDVKERIGALTYIDMMELANSLYATLPNEIDDENDVAAALHEISATEDE